MFLHDHLAVWRLERRGVAVVMFFMSSLYGHFTLFVLSSCIPIPTGLCCNAIFARLLFITLRTCSVCPPLSMDDIISSLDSFIRPHPHLSTRFL